MMKKLGVFALCAALILMVFVQPASAAGGLTITQVKESAPEYWETGIMKNGEQVSAPVYVPDVEQMPVLRVKRGHFSDEKLTEVFGDRPYENEEGRGFLLYHFTDGFEFYGDNDRGFYATASIIDVWQKKWKPTFARIYTDRAVWEEGVIPSLETTYAQGQTVALSETVRMMQEKFAELHEGRESLFVEDITVNSPVVYSKGYKYSDELYPLGDELTGKGCYIIEGTQTLRGVPVLSTLSKGFQGLYNTENSYLIDWVSSQLPYALIFVADEDHYSVNSVKLEEAQVLAEDVPLCSAQEAIAAIEPLINEGKVINVYSLELGYVVCADREISYPSGRREGWADAVYRVVPMWICECSYVHDPNREYPDEESEDPGAHDPRSLDWHHAYFMVNGQTGELIDRNNTSKERIYAPQLVTWDDVK